MRNWSCIYTNIPINPKNRVLVTIFLLLPVSCTEILDLDPQERFVVVHGVLVNEPRQEIYLNYTSYLSDEDLQPIDDAEVWVEEENENGLTTHVYRYKAVGGGCWVSEFIPRPYTRYRLFVKVTGHPEIRATTVYPGTEGLSGLRCTKDDYSFFSNYMPLYLWIYGQDYQSEKEVYHVPGHVCGQDYMILYDGDKNVIEDFACIDPFNQTEVVSDPQPMVKHHRFLRVEISAINASQISICHRIGLVVLPDFADAEDGLPHAKSCVVFDSVSEEYDRYMKSVIMYDLSSPDVVTDFTQLYESPVEITSNIEHGLGVFGAVYRKKMPYLQSYYE